MHSRFMFINASESTRKVRHLKAASGSSSGLNEHSDFLVYSMADKFWPAVGCRGDAKALPRIRTAQSEVVLLLSL